MPIKKLSEREKWTHQLGESIIRWQKKERVGGDNKHF